MKLLDCAGAEVASTVTAADGSYIFENVAPGTNYKVKFILPAGKQFTSKDSGSDDGNDSDADETSGETACFPVGPGDNLLTWDAGLVPGVQQ